MQKRLLFVAAVCAMVFVGCKKDTEVVTLGVQNEISSNGKVYIDGSYNPCFLQSGEQVNVNGVAYDVEYSNGQYKVSCAQDAEGNYYAVYPATNSCTGSTCTIALPHFQEYDCDADGVQNVKLPAGASILGNSGTKLYFYNLCSLLEVQWTNNTSADYQVTGIEVTVPGKAIWGTGTATLAGTSSALVMDESNNANKSNNRVILSIPTSKRETVAANGGVSRKYYVVLPTFESKRILVNVRVSNTSTAEGQKVLSIKKSTGSAVNMPRNYIVPLHLSDAPAQDNELSGYFSVSPSLKVVFSRGNLQHVGTNSPTTGTWKFADRQYDFFGLLNLANPAQGDVLSTTEDLFAWSESATGNYGMYTFDYDDADWSGPGSFADWAGLPIAGTSTSENWFTMTAKEWRYLLTQRPNASNLRAKARITNIENHPARGHYYSGVFSEQVTEVEGFILLPDDWTSASLPGTLSFDPEGECDDNEYTAAQWALLEAMGAMFLPSAGWGEAQDEDIDEDTYGSAVNFTFQEGAYWTATKLSKTGLWPDACYLYFKQQYQWYLMVSNAQGDYVSSGTAAGYDTDWWHLRSVRLVKPALGYSISDREDE